MSLVISDNLMYYCTCYVSDGKCSLVFTLEEALELQSKISCLFTSAGCPLNLRVASCMTGQNFGILSQKGLGKANHFLPFNIKSLLTFMSSKFCKNCKESICLLSSFLPDVLNL